MRITLTRGSCRGFTGSTLIPQIVIGVDSVLDFSMSGNAAANMAGNSFYSNKHLNIGRI
jgi:hypothetical protein